jgi:hypothetical protein
MPAELALPDGGRLLLGSAEGTRIRLEPRGVAVVREA